MNEGVEARSNTVGVSYWRKEFDTLAGAQAAAQAAVAELRRECERPYIWSYVKGQHGNGAFERLKA